MSIFENILFVISIIIYELFDLKNNPIDTITKFLFFQNIYWMILFISMILFNYYSKYKKYLK